MGIRTQIHHIMHGRRHDPWPTATLLRAVSRVYDPIGRMRAGLYARGVLNRRRLPCPVVSVGNLTLGGTGKTPMIIYLARFILQKGAKPVIISRGYKGSAEKRGGVVCDGRSLLMTADMSGDEPYMLAAQLETVPVLVGRDRYRMGTVAMRRFQPDVILLDDGFQHLKLYRDLDLVLLDAHHPFGNGFLFPRGVLRERPQAICRGSALILTRSTPQRAKPTVDRIAAIAAALPVFRSNHVPYVAGLKPRRRRPQAVQWPLPDNGAMAGLQSKRLFAFSGIARNDDFQRTLAGCGCRLVGGMTFSDHHRYAGTDLEQIAALAKKAKADAVVTTAKDHARIGDQIDWPLDLIVVGVRIGFEGSDFDRFLERHFIRLGVLPRGSLDIHPTTQAHVDKN